MLKYKLWKKYFLLTAGFIGILAVLGLILIFSAVVCVLTDDYSDLSAFAGIALGTGTLFSGFLCGKYRRKRGLLEGVLCGFVIYVIMLTAGSFCFGFFSCLNIKKLLLSALCGAIGGVFGVNTKYPESLYQ
jgi:putative membrane protein (TIGR04086 family)